MEITTIFQELKKHRWVNLSHGIHENIPHFSAFKPLKEKTLFTLEQDGFFAKEYTLATQYGTHIDAPIHFAKQKRYLQELDLKELLLPLYVIHKEKEVQANPDYEVSLQDILDFEATHGTLPEDAFVAFSSGWSKRWDSKENFYNLDADDNAHTPGWSLEALNYLCETRNITAIGHETLDTDSSKQFRKNNALLAELYILSQDKYQVEVLKNLDILPATGAYISISFPNILDAPGFPVRAIAYLP